MLGLLRAVHFSVFCGTAGNGVWGPCLSYATVSGRCQDGSLSVQLPVVWQESCLRCESDGPTTLGPVSKAYRAVEKHACKRLRRWLCAKHKEVRPGTKRFPEASWQDVLGLVRVAQRTRNLPWASSVAFLREPEAGNPHIAADQPRNHPRSPLGNAFVLCRHTSPQTRFRPISKYDFVRAISWNYVSPGRP